MVVGWNRAAGGVVNSAVNGGSPSPRRGRIGSLGVRSRSAGMASREARLKALARELLRQAQLAANRDDERFKGQRLAEVERVLTHLGPGAGQSQLQADVERLRGPKQPQPVPREPRGDRYVRRRGPAMLCNDCGVREVYRAKKYCDDCATRRGFLVCRRCGGMFPHANMSTVQFSLCHKCSKKHSDRGSSSVRTISGGLPTLGKRR